MKQARVDSVAQRRGLPQPLRWRLLAAILACGLSLVASPASMEWKLAPAAPGETVSLISDAAASRIALSPSRDAGRTSRRPVITAADTINGHRLEDPDIIQRIERIAATIPASLLATRSRGEQARYLAHGFGPDDDAAISYGVFEEPAAALAFGCALDRGLLGHCEIASPSVAHEPYEVVPGVRCEPMGIALGAPAFEPDHCVPID